MKKNVFLLVGVLIVLVVIFRIGYGAFSVSDKQQIGNTFTSGCLDITLEDVSSAIDLQNTKPITDVEGLLTPGYTFTIKNHCDNPSNYQVNLETLLDPSLSTTLQDRFVRVAIKSDSNDYLITNLTPDENEIVIPYLKDSKKSYNLTSGVIEANETKEFTLKEWMDYDTTKEQGASKQFQSKINVTGGTNFNINTDAEIKFVNSGNKVKGTIKGQATNVVYCTSITNECEPEKNVEIQENQVSISIANESNTKQVATVLGNLEVYTSDKTITCVKLDNKKTICSEPYKKDLTPSFNKTSDEMDKEESPFACEFDGNAVQSLTGMSTEETCQKIYKVVMQGTTIYSDDLQPMIDQQFGQYYQGPGEWDEASSTCKYGENIVTDLMQNPIKEREKCGKVYEQRGQYISINAIDLLTMESGGQVEYAGEGTWKEAYGKTGIYEAEDDDGTSYYYRGAVTNNYVEFAGFYWRIIRINGNGSIRLLYSGIKSEIDDVGRESILKNGYNDRNTQYTEIELSTGKKTGPFNKSYDDNAYVGFRYGTAQSETYELTHANDNDSNAKYELDKWFQENLLSFQNKLDVDAGFCGDRSIAEGSGEGIGKSVTNYKGYERYASAKPTLKCPNNNHDYYTVKGAKKGNKSLTYPIGLITMDEIMFAGGSAAENTSYYLYNGDYYWALSPGGFGGSYAFVFDVYNVGGLDSSNVRSGNAFRPVINVDSNKVVISGLGTIESPYVFE